MRAGSSGSGLRGVVIGAPVLDLEATRRMAVGMGRGTGEAVVVPLRDRKEKEREDAERIGCVSRRLSVPPFRVTVYVAFAFPAPPLCLRSTLLRFASSSSTPSSSAPSCVWLRADARRYVGFRGSSRRRSSSLRAQTSRGSISRNIQRVSFLRGGCRLRR